VEWVLPFKVVKAVSFAALPNSAYGVV